jgi:hypothetical protein
MQKWRERSPFRLRRNSIESGTGARTGLYVDLRKMWRHGEKTDLGRNSGLGDFDAAVDRSTEYESRAILRCRGFESDDIAGLPGGWRGQFKEGRNETMTFVASRESNLMDLEHFVHFWDVTIESMLHQKNEHGSFLLTKVDRNHVALSTGRKNNLEVPPLRANNFLRPSRLRFRALFCTAMILQLSLISNASFSKGKKLTEDVEDNSQTISRLPVCFCSHDEKSPFSFQTAMEIISGRLLCS